MQLELYAHTFHARFEALAVPGFDLMTFIDRAASYGMCGVNVSVMPFTPLIKDEDAMLEQVRARLDSHGMGIDLETRGTDPDHLRSVIACAKIYGAQQIRTYTLRDGTRREIVDKAIRDFRAVVPELEESGIVLLAENHEDLCSIDVLEIMERVGHPQVQVLFDYGNSMVFGEDPQDALARLGPYSRGAHLKDHVVIPAECSGDGEPAILGVPFGEGNLDIVGTTHTLIKDGLTRICVENCWAYLTRFRVQVGDEVLDRGAFTYRNPPYRDEVCLLDANSCDPGQLVGLERATLETGLTWLKRAFARAGIELRRDLNPVL